MGLLRTDINVEDLFEIKEHLGSGKFGKVYLVRDKATGGEFAAKQCACRRASERRDFENEVAIMNDLDHPKLLRLHDSFIRKNTVTLILELATGGELFDRISDEEFDLTEQVVTNYLRQIIDAIGYMHSLNILHLDIKPENILCVHPDRLDQIKIIDFGFARRLTNEPLKIMFGTPEFVAPEVVNFDPLGKGSDMWSIGVMAYVLLSGLSPFLGDNDQETLSNVTTAELDFDDECFDEVSPEAKHFIEKLLVLQERKRPSCETCLREAWLSEVGVAGDGAGKKGKSLNTAKDNIKKFVTRRKWAQSINAVIAVSRLQAGLKKLTAGAHAQKSQGTDETAAAAAADDAAASADRK